MEKEYIKILRVRALSGLTVFLAAGLVLLLFAYTDYRGQLTAAAGVLTAGQEKADAARLLKQETDQEDERKAQEVLEQYGYTGLGATVYGRRFQKKAALLAGLLLLLYGLYLFSLYRAGRSEKERRQREIGRISQVLTEFRQGRYQEEIWEHLGEETGQDLYMQLESLAGYLRVLTEQSQREKEETKALVTDISHQLKTPVAALQACFEVLQKEELTQEERREFSIRCEQQLNGLTRLVEALVQISRMETGMIEIQKEPAVIFETLLEAVNRVYLKAREKQIEIGMETAQRLQSLRFIHDKKWLCEAFINLLENGIKYSPPGSCITIRMMERSSLLRIEIEDEGIGIPREEQHRIFKRFYRGSQKEVKGQPGSGVGLYLTREIIRRHGGTIMVSSPPGQKQKGSLFIIQLPDGGEERRASAKPSPEP